ncbi:MAG TPA: hypothetical protein GX702_07065 [Chloroflexi bacterium]|nr:hypothetical protein [Chloroflexota bacterium]
MSGLAAFWRENRAIILFFAALAIAFVALRSSPSDIGSVDEFAEVLHQGQPSIVYFYSNY